MTTAASLERQLWVGGELLSIVGTMKGLAAVSIQEFEEAVRALREYTLTVELGLQVVFSRRPDLIPADDHSQGRIVAVVVGTDQGLCGPINREIAREAALWLENRSVEADERWVVSLGARVARELRLIGVGVDEGMQLPSSVEAVGALVEDLILRIDEWRHEQGVGRVMVFYQHPLQRTRRAPRVRQVIPPDVRRLEAIASRPWPTRMLADTPHGWSEALTGLLREDLVVALYRSVAEAKAAEHGARLSAMQAAEQNIEERLDRLRTRYHQVRQAQITAELLDVVSGFEALREE